MRELKSISINYNDFGTVRTKNGLFIVEGDWIEGILTVQKGEISYIEFVYGIVINKNRIRLYNITNTGFVVEQDININGDCILSNNNLTYGISIDDVTADNICNVVDSLEKEISFYRAHMMDLNNQEYYSSVQNNIESIKEEVASKYGNEISRQTLIA